MRRKANIPISELFHLEMYLFHLRTDHLILGWGGGMRKDIFGPGFVFLPPCEPVFLFASLQSVQ